MVWLYGRFKVWFGSEAASEHYDEHEEDGQAMTGCFSGGVQSILSYREARIDALQPKTLECLQMQKLRLLQWSPGQVTTNAVIIVSQAGWADMKNHTVAAVGYIEGSALSVVLELASGT